MATAIQSGPQALVENVARQLPPKARDDFRILLNETVLSNIAALSPGGNLIQPGGTPARASAPPVGVTHTTTGANAAYTVSISNPSSATLPIYHEVSYAPQVNFRQNVTTLPPTTATQINIPAPGVNGYVRVRSSFDKQSWSNYQLSSTMPIDAGLVSSSALEPAATFNQTNYAQVTSTSTGSGDVVNINGTGGNLTPYIYEKGGVQSLRPSATVVGLVRSQQQFISWTGSQYQLNDSLSGALPDGQEPVGAVTVGSAAVGGGTAQGNNGGRLYDNQQGPEGGGYASSFTAPANEFIYSYNATTGLFTAQQPNFTNIAGVATPAQLPEATSATFGIVKPDNSTITISGGVISAVGGGGLSVAKFTLTPAGPGAFTVAHGLAVVPTAVMLQPTSGIALWLNNVTPWDATNFYYDASFGGTGLAFVYYTGGVGGLVDSNVSITATGPGTFQVPHHLGVTPTAVTIQMTSATAIWLTGVFYDATYIYLEAASAGTAIAVCTT